jgi:hypothetical protein
MASSATGCGVHDCKKTRAYQASPKISCGLAMGAARCHRSMQPSHGLASCEKHPVSSCAQLLTLSSAYRTAQTSLLLQSSIRQGLSSTAVPELNCRPVRLRLPAVCMPLALSRSRTPQILTPASPTAMQPPPSLLRGRGSTTPANQKPQPRCDRVRGIMCPREVVQFCCLHPIVKKAQHPPARAPEIALYLWIIDRRPAGPLLKAMHFCYAASTT